MVVERSVMTLYPVTESKLYDWYTGRLQDESANSGQTIGWAEYIACPLNVTIGWVTAHPAHPVPAPLSPDILHISVNFTCVRFNVNKRLYDIWSIAPSLVDGHLGGPFLWSDAAARDGRDGDARDWLTGLATAGVSALGGTAHVIFHIG